MNLLRPIISAVLFSVTMSPGVFAADTVTSAARPLFQFGAKDHADWQIVADGIMGGVSKGRQAGTADGHLMFTGSLSLRNNGGFVTMRSPAKALGLSKESRIQIRAKGDGRTYQLTLWTKGPLADYVASYANGTTTLEDLTNWRVSLPTVKDDWIEKEFTIADFIGNVLGQPLDQPLLERPEGITSIGIGISDKVEGGFRLEVGHILVR
jgi:NADH dehydrogenase [ubiquinone] 1 alpha subcomplex assembly factor 1